MAGNEDILKSVAQTGVIPAPEAIDKKRVKPDRSPETAQDFAVQCARLLNDLKCEDIVVLDLRGVSPICDFFVIATGTSERQMQSAADHLKALGKSAGNPPYGTSGYDDTRWIVVDFIDVIVHIFDGENRAFYDLDSLWGDREHVRWE